MASRVDNLYFFLIAVSAFFTVLVVALVVLFAVRYRRRQVNDVGAPIHGSLALELVWTGIPLILAMVLFVWGASVYFALARPPAETLDIYAVGKQWMWKFQHREGQREINTLHVPANVPVRMIITAEDVLHSLYLPSFRVKMDAIPGRYTQLWFTATTPGQYHLFCAEYCGTNHSGMIGSVYVMEPEDYQAWLGGGTPTGTLAQAGEQLFTQLACVTCHTGGDNQRGPVLNGLLGSTVELAGGEKLTATPEYVRESILNPTAKIVAGFPPIMPTFQGQVSEEQLLALTEYIKSLPAVQHGPGAPGGPAAQPATQPGGAQPAAPPSQQPQR
jgi:cytochrome c oxidase subunit II